MDRPPLDPRELLEAFARVRENGGCPGVDSVTVDHFAEGSAAACDLLAEQLRTGTYRAFPLRQIIVEKKSVEKKSVEKKPGSKEHRTLLVPTVRDRVVQTAVARRLSRSFEEEFLESSFAYRPHRGVDRAIARIRMLRDQGYWHVVDADIHSFFDNVEFIPLETQLAGRGEPDWLTALVGEWIRCPAWDGTRLRARAKGLPQGSPVSPLLANLFLMPLDMALASRDWKLVRYADDFVVLTRTPAEAAQALGLITIELEKLQLELNASKTQITSFDTGLHFLGVFFQKEEIWTPWRDGPRDQGRVLGMARGMPAEQLERFRSPRTPTVMETALTGAGVRYIPSGTAHLKGAENEVAYLYLTEQGSVLRKSGDRFLLEHEDKIVLDIPYHKLEQVLVFGHVQVTSQAMVEMMEKGVDISFFSWGGRFHGSLAARKGSNIRDRMLQYELWHDAGRVRETAHAVVANKIANARGVVEWLAGRRNQMRELAPVRDQLAELEQSALGAVAADLDTVRGYEGAAARAYFEAWGTLNRSESVWAGRSMHPPKDEINALLSLAYTLLTQELAGLLEADGLETALGFLHEFDGARPSLALDLVEAFRHPVADRFVLSLLERGEFGREDFGHGEGEAVLLTGGAMRRFFGFYEAWMVSKWRTGTVESPTFRELLRREARRFILFLRGQAGLQLYRFAPDEVEGGEPGGCDISSVTT